MWVQLLAIAGTALVAATIAHVARELLLSPLAAFPGPKMAAVTRLWMFFQSQQKTKFLTIHELHKLYGPVVRIRPNELSISEPAAIAAIYASGDLLKDPSFYNVLDSDGTPPSLVSMTDPKEHSARHRMLAHVFSRTSVAKIYETLLKPRLEELVQVIVDSHTSRFDILAGSRAFAADFLAQLIFGKASGCLREPTLTTFLTKAISVVSHTVPIALEFPILLNMPLAISTRLHPDMKHVAYLHEWAGRCWDDYSSETAYPTVFQRYAGHPSLSADAERSRKLVVNDALAMLVGGTDNVSSTISFAAFELARDSELQRKLHLELCDACSSASVDSLPPWPGLQRLPLLSAVIRETMRVYTAITTGLPRVVARDGLKVHGKEIPEGTVVSMQHWTVHRNPVAFPNPELFDPYRWIHNVTGDMETCFIPYSRGPRACIAADLASAEIYAAVAILFRKFRVSLASSAKIPANMELIDKTVLDVASGKIELVFDSYE